MDGAVYHTQKYPFNNSKKTIALSGPNIRYNKNYTIIVEVENFSGGCVGEIAVSDKLLNGFKIAYTGSAKSVDLKIYVQSMIYQRFDGRWEARTTGNIDYQTGKPKRVSVYGKTKTEVIGKLREKQKAIDPTSTKFFDWLTYCLEIYKKNNIKQSTHVSYRGYIDRHVAAGFPVMKLKDLTSRAIGKRSGYEKIHICSL